jgi:hypothetical protein
MDLCSDFADTPQETSYKTLIVAHLYALDHVILQVFHYIFFYTYWYINSHDGKRLLNSQAQKDIVELAVSRHEVEPIDTTGANDEHRAALALDIWNHEKGYALGVVFLGFLMKVSDIGSGSGSGRAESRSGTKLTTKIYFILVLYSYAAHLRSSTYHNLPLTTHAGIGAANSSPGTNGSSSGNGTARTIMVADVDDDDRELASAEAEVARINEEAAAKTTVAAKKKVDDDDDWE